MGSGPAGVAGEVFSAPRATSERNGSAVIISVAGEVDAANEGAWKRLLYEVAAITLAPGPVVIDIGNLDFIGACGYTALAREALRCQRRGVSLCLVCHQPIVGRIVAACELRQMLPLYPTIETALLGATAGSYRPVNPDRSALEKWPMVGLVRLRASCASNPAIGWRWLIRRQNVHRSFHGPEGWRPIAPR